MPAALLEPTSSRSVFTYTQIEGRGYALHHVRFRGYSFLDAGSAVSKCVRTLRAAGGLERVSHEAPTQVCASVWKVKKNRLTDRLSGKRKTPPHFGRTNTLFPQLLSCLAVHDGDTLPRTGRLVPACSCTRPSSPDAFARRFCQMFILFGPPENSGSAHDSSCDVLRCALETQRGHTNTAVRPSPDAPNAQEHIQAS